MDVLAIEGPLTQLTLYAYRNLALFVMSSNFKKPIEIYIASGSNIPVKRSKLFSVTNNAANRLNVLQLNLTGPPPFPLASWFYFWQTTRFCSPKLQIMSISSSNIQLMKPVYSIQKQFNINTITRWRSSKIRE